MGVGGKYLDFGRWSVRPYKKGVFAAHINDFLCKKNSPGSAVDLEGNTLFHQAVIYNEHRSLRTLLELGISTKKKNALGLTPEDLIRMLGREGFYGMLPPKDLPKILVRGKKDQTLSISQFEDMFSVGYAENLSFKNYSILKWTLKKTEQQLTKKSVDLGNKWSMALFHKEVAFGKKPPVYLKWVSPLIGYGLFAEKEIPALSYVGEYTGLMRRRLLRKDTANHFVFGYNIGPKETPYVIDANKRGNLTRFINHSDAPNLTSRWMIHSGISHVVFFSNKLIPKDTQLTYDYGPLYWKRRSNPMDL